MGRTRHPDTPVPSNLRYDSSQKREDFVAIISQLLAVTAGVRFF
jgi:hypothetical protein